MHGFLDLHSHWVPAIDDGVRTVDEGLALLRALRSIGFDHVVATPHMRPGLFDNDRAAIEQAFSRMLLSIEQEPQEGLPTVSLGAEHFFSDVVFERLLTNEGVPYRGGHAVLVELAAERFPVRLADRFFDLRRKRLRPVLAHPERYVEVWKNKKVLDPIVDGGSVLLLDVAALVGKYGRQPERAAHRLLEEGYYYAACSDAHRPADAGAVAAGIERLKSVAGPEEAMFLLRDGPREIVEGRVKT